MQCDERPAIGERKVGVVEAGRNGATHERPMSAAEEPTTLPDASRHDELRLMTGGQVVADDYNFRASIGPKLKHLNSIAGIEVERLVAADDMDRGERVRCEQVIDGGRDGAVADIVVWQ